MFGAPDFPQQSEGKHFLRNPSVSCLNIFSVGTTPKKYHYISDSIKSASGAKIDHVLEGEGTPLGSYRAAGNKAGSLSIQYDKPGDTDIVAGFVIVLNKGNIDALYGSSDEYYQVDDGGQSIKRNDLKRASLPLVKMVNPVSVLCQSANGNYYLAPPCSNAGADVTIAPNFQNWRTGTVKSYSALSSDGTALPVGVTINAGTGLITIAHGAAVIGTYEIDVTATDTLAGSSIPVREGTARIFITVTA